MLYIYIYIYVICNANNKHDEANSYLYLYANPPRSVINGQLDAELGVAASRPVHRLAVPSACTQDNNNIQQRMNKTSRPMNLSKHSCLLSPRSGTYLSLGYGTYPPGHGGCRARRLALCV